MLAVSWNVNGLRAVTKKGIVPWEVIPGTDVIGLQEVRARTDQIGELAEPDGWHAHWFAAEKPGYSGVAILSRAKPDEVVEGMGEPDFDREGRVLTARFGDLIVVSAYFPNSQELGARVAYKIGFCTAMERHLAAWRARGCSTVLLGDYNIAHQAIDLARPADNEQNAGYLPQERAWFSRYLSLGYRDVFRERNPGLTGAYSWWTMRGGARARNVGWRIDYATVSPELIPRVSDAQIHHTIMGSDHCPVSITLA
jgi:exodeoxyribonuclease III